MHLQDIEPGQAKCGIKFTCFHVCQSDLPPCNDHDLFEGVVSTRLVLLSHLVSEGELTFHLFRSESMDESISVSWK